MQRIIRRAALGAVAFVAGLGLASAPAHAADLGFAPGSVTGLSASSQAGAHADFRTSFELTRNAAGDPVRTPKDITVDMPKGFVGNPTVTPRCTAARVADPFGAEGACPASTAIGEATFTVRDGYGGDMGPYTALLYNVEPAADQPAAFMFFALLYPVRLDVSVEPGGGYNIRAKISNITEAQPLVHVDVTLWGVPADQQGPGDKATVYGEPYGAPLDGAPRRPFLTNPSTCTGQLLRTTYNAVPWSAQENPVVPATGLSSAQTGCDQQSFTPSVDVQPASKRAGQPAGYQVDVDIPQSDDPNGLGTPPLKDAVVSLPEGVSISPPGADGLAACSDEQLDRSSKAVEACPDASKIGSTTINTPLLNEPLEGSIYLGTQQSQDPMSGDMYRIFITASGSGVRIKLRGQIKADPATGRLTASFVDNPELPFSKLRLTFKDGPRSVLVNPPTCGEKATSSTLSSWGGQSREVTDAFAINEGCDTTGFSPGFTAGTVNPFAGGVSPFTMSVFRNDGDQDLSRIKLDLPPGLLGALGSVPVCADAQAAAGTCGADTRLGSTTVGVGSGSQPFSLPGTVSLAGPYKGAPFSLSIAVPAKAGPLDLGLVVVRSPLLVDAKSATVSAPVDDLPSIVGGVPLHYRSINVTLDRPGFMFNATNCNASTINATLTGAGGAVASPSSRYQPQGCDRLVLNPTLKMAYSGKADLKKGKNPKLTADLGQSFGQAGLRRVAVTLPLLSSLKPENAKALCTPAQAATRACPEASIVGRASATTPALHGSLTGPVYFVEGTRRTATGRIVKTLPKLWLKLAGDGVPLDLWADSSIDNKTKRLIATFTDIPDAPIANFKLEIDGGKNGILTATADPCTATRTATAQFDGQNGGRTIRNIAIAVPECGTRATVAASSKGVTVRFSGIAAGKLTVSGKGIRTTRKTIKRAGLATVVAPLASDAKARLAAGRAVTVTVTATYDPSGKGRTVKTTKKVTIKPAKAATRAAR
jgi:hypothetical protein